MACRCPIPTSRALSGRSSIPKDIETIDIQRGGYSADFGDRAYGVFNSPLRWGFERNREAEAVVSYGNLHETNDQFSVGDHSDRLVYYVSGNVNTSDVGPPPLNVRNAARSDGRRRRVWIGDLPVEAHRSDPALVSSLRGDRYEVPNTPDDQAAGIDDIERERDGFVNLSWMHTVGSKAFLTVSPFYHYNRAAFDGGTADPIVTTTHRTSNYVGGQVVLALPRARRTTSASAAYGFFQHDSLLFGLQSVDGWHPTEPGAGAQRQRRGVVRAGSGRRATDRITLNGGIRLTHFSGSLSENGREPSHRRGDPHSRRSGVGRSRVFRPGPSAAAAHDDRGPAPGRRRRPGVRFSSAERRTRRSV